jgi:hypothetical protein
MEEEYGEIKPPFTIADSAKKFTEMFLPEKRTPEVSASGSPPPSIQQDYKDPQQKENIEKLSKSIEKLKDARKDSEIVGDTITKPDTQLGPYSIFKTTYEGLEASVKEISDIKNNLDNKVAELNAYAEKKSKEKTTPIEQIALRAVIDTHKKIKGEYEKYIVELVAKIKEAGELLTAEKETYDKVSIALQNVTKGKKEPATPPPVKKAKKKAEEEEEEKKKAEEEEEEEDEEEEEEEEEGEEEEEEEEGGEKQKNPAEGRVGNAKKALEMQLNTYDGKIDFIKKQFLSIKLDSETLNKDIIDNILIKLFSGKKWNTGEEYCKSFYDKKTCDTSFYSFIKKSKQVLINDLNTKLRSRRAGPLNTIIKSLLYSPTYNEEQKTEIRNLLNAFEMQEKLWDKYPNEQPQKGGYRRRTPDHKKPGKRVTRRH